MLNKFLLYRGRVSLAVDGLLMLLLLTTASCAAMAAWWWRWCWVQVEGGGGRDAGGAAAEVAESGQHAQLLTLLIQVLTTVPAHTRTLLKKK